MKRRRIIILCICALLVCIFAGILTACGADQELEGVEVVYEFEGGTYKNGVRATHYYNLKPGAECHLVAPETIDEKNKPTRPGYTFVGWYQTKTEDPETGKVIYSDPWDFKKDTITSESERVTLYAEWKENFGTYYELCYRNDAGEVVSIARYDVLDGSKFDNSAQYSMVDEEGNIFSVGIPDEDAASAANQIGCTVKKECVDGKSCVRYLDKDGNGWDPEFTHPGDEGDQVEVEVTTDPDTGEVLKKECTVKVFVEFVDGVFTYVSNAAELSAVVKDRTSIELLADIDFEGETFNGFANSSSRVYGGVKNIVDQTPVEVYIKGNGHTIKNFKLGYNAGSLVGEKKPLESGSLVVSLFGMMDHARIEDISFTGVTIDLTADNSLITYIYVAPIAATATSSTIRNVSFTGTFKVTKVPDGFSMNKLFVESEKAVHVTPTDDSKIEGKIEIALTTLSG